jgi:hypothetical protein
VDKLSITNGLITYAERAAPGADPAVLTFDAVTLSVAGIANRGAATATIELRGQGDLMSAGTLKVLIDTDHARGLRAPLLRVPQRDGPDPPGCVR